MRGRERAAVVSGRPSILTLVPNGNIVFGGSGSNRTVTITPATNQFGSATITVTASDAREGASSGGVGSSLDLDLGAQREHCIWGFGFEPDGDDHAGDQPVWERDHYGDGE